MSSAGPSPIPGADGAPAPGLAAERSGVRQPLHLGHVHGPFYVSNKVYPDRDEDILRRAGIGAVVNLVEDLSCAAQGSVAYLHEGFPDGTYVPSARLAAIDAFVAKHRAATNVLVHCSAGVSRSAGIVVGILMRDRPGRGWDDAIGCVERVRPTWVAEEIRASVLAHVTGSGPPAEEGELATGDAAVLRRLETRLARRLSRVAYVGWDSRGFAVEAGRIVGLGLHGLDLPEPPPEIAELPMLRVLELSHNRLATLSSVLGHLARLERINVSDNRLGVLPETIGDLTALRELNAARNRIARLPDGLGMLAGLERLCIHQNCLEALPDTLGGLRGLRELCLQANRIAAVPAAIGGLAALERLALNENRIRRLPAELGALPRLRALNLSTNLLTGVPDEIGELAGLDNLNLGRNPLAAFPRCLLRLPALRRLNLALTPHGLGAGAAADWADEIRARGLVIERVGAPDSGVAWSDGGEPGGERRDDRV